MKANKALKRLTKIEALISELVKRYSKALNVRGALENAKAAVARVKEVVGAAAPKTAKPKRKPAAKARRVNQGKAVVKKTARKLSKAKSVKKSAPVKKTVRKIASAPVPEATEAAASGTDAGF